MRHFRRLRYHVLRLHWHVSQGWFCIGIAKYSALIRQFCICIRLIDFWKELLFIHTSIILIHSERPNAEFPGSRDQKYWPKLFETDDNNSPSFSNANVTREVCGVPYRVINLTKSSDERKTLYSSAVGFSFPFVPLTPITLPIFAQVNSIQFNWRNNVIWFYCLWLSVDFLKKLTFLHPMLQEATFRVYCEDRDTINSNDLINKWDCNIQRDPEGETFATWHSGECDAKFQADKMRYELFLHTRTIESSHWVMVSNTKNNIYL